MITEDFVNFETAKLLKEKGFDWACETKRFYPEPDYDQESPNGVYAPTFQMAMKWLREVHHITIGITFSLNIITYEIEKDEEFITAIGSSRSYEDMVEEAIKYCLENLI